MKHKRQPWKTALTVLCAGFVLTGCGGEKDASSAAPTAPPSPAPDAPATVLTMLADPMGITTSTQSDAGYYELFRGSDSGSNILYTDFATRTRVFLCSRPECTHRDDSCTSWIPNARGDLLLAAWDDSLYCIQIGSAVQNPTKDDLMQLWRMQADGSGRELLYTFDNLHYLHGGVAGGGETLYFPLNVWTEDLSDQKVQLGAFHLDTSEFELLCDLDGVDWIGCSGSEMFFSKITPAAEQPETMNELMQHTVSAGYTVQFTALDVDTLQWRDVGEPVFCRAYTMEGDRLLWIDGKELSLQQMDPASGEVTLVTDRLPLDAETNVPSFSAQGDVLFLSLLHRDGESGKEEYCSVDLNSGELLGGTPVTASLSGKQAYPARILAESEDMYLLLSRDEMVQSIYYGTDGTAQPIAMHIARLAMIDKQDYWQGSDTSTPITDMVWKES